MRELATCRSLNDPARRCPRGLGRSISEATPRGFNLRLGGSMATRPCLCGICREFRDVEPNNRTGCAVNESGVLGGFRLRRQPKADHRDTSPAYPHYLNPSSPAAWSLPSNMHSSARSLFELN